MYNSRNSTNRSESESTLADSTRGGSGHVLPQHTSRLSAVHEDNKKNIVSKLTRSSSSASNSSQDGVSPTTGKNPLKQLVNKISTDTKKNVISNVTRSTSASSDSSQSRVIPTSKKLDNKVSQRSAVPLRSDSEASKQIGKTSKKTGSLFHATDLIARAIDHVTKHDGGDKKSKFKSAFTLDTRGGRNNQSTFEKVDRHNGHTTYLGSGSFSRLEDCIANCLSSGHSRTSNKHHDFPFKRLTRASVLEDYSYDGISSPYHHQELRSHSNHHYSHHDHHHHSHHDYYSPDHRKSAAELSLNEIHQVNDALAKYGVPVFSHHGHHHSHHDNHHHHGHHDNHHHDNHHHGHHHNAHHNQHHYHKPGHIGEILSACQLLMHDPTIASLKPGTQAVSHAWNAIQHHPPPAHPQGYPSSPGPGVPSHLFGGPQQTPYNPVQGPPSQFSSSGPPPSSYNPGQSAISRLFGGGGGGGGGPPPSPPPQGPPPPFYGGGPPQNSYNPVQGVASRLFG